MTDDPYDELVRTEPHDLPAEQAAIGAALLSQNAARDMQRQLQATDFYRPAHATLHTAIGELLTAGEVPNPLTLAAHLQQNGHLDRVGGRAYLHTCVENTPTAATADWYAHRIRQLALRRALVRTGIRIANAGYAPEGDPAELAELAVQMVRDVRDAGRAAADSPVQDILDFLAVQDAEHDWVIPGLLEHGDRVIWTAGEGGGKSVLLRQIAVTAAAGLLPFDGKSNEAGPQKVLVLDCENSERQSRRHYRGLIHTADTCEHPVKRGQLHIDCRPEGVDLTRADGRAWLMRRVEEVMPDLLIVGPVYRLHTGDPNSEEHARKVTVALDHARLTAHSALVMEAHAAKANGFGPRGLAPVGSSLWLRWPEFGFGLRPVEDERSAQDDRARRVVPWRGARDERAWPQYLRQGYSDSWPWRPYKPIDADPYTGHSKTGAIS